MQVTQPYSYRDEVRQLRIALVHDWLTGYRGGEKCLELLCQLWPHADLYTLIYQPNHLPPAIRGMHVKPSWLNRLPGVTNYYRYLLPVMPFAISGFELARYDVVLSLSHCVAKSVSVPAGVPHICYCFTPMRYAWHMRDAYLAGQPPWLRPIQQAALAALRAWDRRTAAGVSQFVAISETVRKRIRFCYGRDSEVVYPPANVDFYTPGTEPREGFYLCVSALVPYKRVDLAVAACNRLKKDLVIIGSGPELGRLKAMAGPTIRFLGWQPDDVIRDYYRRCRALLFPGEEDFGIVPVEAQACGAPVIAYAAGGATESVLPPTSTRPGSGLYFFPQTVEALADAIIALEQRPDMVDPSLARRQALRFSRDRFMKGIVDVVCRTLGLATQRAAAAA